MATRREAARDRAEQAQAYRDLTARAPPSTPSSPPSMESRIAAHARHAIAELEVALGPAQQRAAEATRKINAEARRADAPRPRAAS